MARLTSKVRYDVLGREGGMTISPSLTIVCMLGTGNNEHPIMPDGSIFDPFHELPQAHVIDDVVRQVLPFRLREATRASHLVGECNWLWGYK